MSFYIRVVLTYGQGAIHVLLAMRHQGMMVQCMMLLFGTYGQGVRNYRIDNRLLSYLDDTRQ
jgi:hypothetical protein